MRLNLIKQIALFGELMLPLEWSGTGEHVCITHMENEHDAWALERLSNGCDIDPKPILRQQTLEIF